MAQSGRTIEGFVSLGRLINRATTPDRSSTVKEAQQKFEAAQKRYRTAKLPDRAAEGAASAKESLDIALEKLAKAESAYAIAESNLNATKAATRSPDELQLLVDAVETSRDRADRANRKVDRLKQSVSLTDSKLKRARDLSKPETEIAAIESELEAEQGKLSRASIQFRLRESELKGAEENLKTAQKASKTPEEIGLLEDRLNELRGNVDRAQTKVATAQATCQTAQQDAQTVEADYLKFEAELLSAEAEFERISQATAAEERFAQIEAALGKVDRFSEMGSDISSAIALLPQAEFWWNSLCLGATALVALVYFTPLSSVLQGVTKAAKWTLDGAADVKQSFDSTWSPDLQGTPKVGEAIAGWTVTSAFGRREAPCSGCSTEHGGVDLADPRGGNASMGKQLYAIGRPGTEVELTCWQDSGGGGLVATLKPQSMPGRTIEYLHLSKCALKTGETKTIDAGPVIAAVGNTGVGTAPHAHIQEKDSSGKKVPPQRGVVWWAMTGEEPQPVIAQQRIKP